MQQYGMKPKPQTLRFHGVFAYFEVPKSVYQKALNNWQLHKITNQILPRKTLSYLGRKVDVRIYSNGKVRFTIGATKNPVSFNQINAIYQLIVNELHNFAPEVKHRTLQFRITRCDIHYDCPSLPQLYPVVPQSGTLISVHFLKKRKLYRVEVRGKFNTAIKMLAQILGIAEFSF